MYRPQPKFGLETGSVTNQEIQLIYPATSRARVASAIGDFMCQQNSKKQKSWSKLKFARSAQSEAGLPRGSSQVGAGLFGRICHFKNAIFDETRKSGFSAQSVVSWRLVGFKNAPDLPSRAAWVHHEALLVTFRHGAKHSPPACAGGGHTWAKRK